ncbi:ctr-9 [Symbiodinium pilosum]|uniref:Ctr-9 protein n=1 Tax=Symbiodinium pilosum TaxID=2952 RepID=A0A812LD01_SYMPI|nr:ctr-9 [Symbiodinium pilosum]
MAHVRCQYREARDLYKKCIQTSPDHLAAVYLYTQCLIHERSFSTAVRVIEEAPPQLREEPQVMKLLATGYLATGEHDHQAKAACDRLVIRTPEDFEAWAMRAEVYSRFEKVGYPKETFESYEAMFDLVKDSAAACARVTPQMWNNWGTMLAVYGDPGLAQEAYVRGINSLEEKQRLGDAVGQAAKDLDAAHITLKFNRAWLAASTGGDMLEAIHVYIGLAERCKWFADAFLQLGLEWQRVGKTDEAMRNFQEAMKHSPFMGKLLCSEALRESGKYPEALKWGDRAARHARHDQIHYACVFAGNLYFEASNHYKTKSSSKDGYLRKAMKYFVKALAAKKDCQFAANGIGMVFAERGKFELAKQAFQSVVNHQGMEDNPSVHINLAHSYVQANTSENDIRKAIDLYRAAKNLDPEDKNVRAYIAKAHFMLQEYEDCRDVLAEAIFFKSCMGQVCGLAYVQMPAHNTGRTLSVAAWLTLFANQRFY